MNRLLLSLSLLSLCLGAYGVYSAQLAHQQIHAQDSSDTSVRGQETDMADLMAFAEALGARVLELESSFKSTSAAPFGAQVRAALAEDPQMIFAAVDLMNARETASALERVRPLIENDPIVPVFGNPDGDVTLVEFYDYNCGYCRRSLNDVLDLVTQDGNIRLILKEFPVLSRESQEAAVTALAAAADVDFLALHTLAMNAGGQIGAEQMLDFAEQLGADRATVASRAALERQAYMAALGETQQVAQALNITGTPAFIIGDQIIPGAVGIDELARAIAAARQTADTAQAENQ